MVCQNPVTGIKSPMAGGAMKRQWQVHHQMQVQMDGQRRWDRAYQRLVEWGMTQPTTRIKEETHESAYWPLRTGIDLQSDPNAKHRTANRQFEDGSSRTKRA